MRMLERRFRVQTKLRRRLRRVDRRPVRDAATPRLVLLRQRRPGAGWGGEHGGAQGRPHLVGPSRLDARPTRSRRSSVPFPEPFVHGVGGKRHPTTLECAADVPAACKRVGAALKAAGIPYASQLHRHRLGPDTLGVVVGTWNDVHAEVAAASDRARSVGERRLRPLQRRQAAAARSARAHGRDARRPERARRRHRPTVQSSPTWLVTGTDVAGRDGRRAAR